MRTSSAIQFPAGEDRLVQENGPDRALRPPNRRAKVRLVFGRPNRGSWPRPRNGGSLPGRRTNEDAQAPGVGEGEAAAVVELDLDS